MGHVSMYCPIGPGSMRVNGSMRVDAFCAWCGWPVLISEEKGHSQREIAEAIRTPLIACDECTWEDDQRLTSQGEAAFQAEIISLAEENGWRVYHVSNVKGRLVNKTAVGFPDLVFARWGERRLLIVEVKTEDGEIRATQWWWIRVLRTIPGVDMRIWRPSDWLKIRATLETKN